MLYFTRWKALAIILTALVVCLCAVPNFFPEATVKTWPAWAQRRKARAKRSAGERRRLSTRRARYSSCQNTSRSSMRFHSSGGNAARTRANNSPTPKGLVR